MSTMTETEPFTQKMVLHRSCNRVFRMSQVSPVVRHKDCIAYQCPYCGVAFDDRPEGRGGVDPL